MTTDSASGRRLMSELQTLYKEKWVHIDVNERNLHHWNLGLMVVNPESAWNGAYLRAEMKFPHDYPYSPPKFTFLTKSICHPNVYANGEVCISILHKPGDDEQSGEQSCERWSPLQGAESVLRSVLLLMDDPEIKSPANVDASICYRDQRESYNRRAAEVAAGSRRSMPPDVRFPTLAELEPAPLHKPVDDDAFWQESGDDEDVDFDDLGGSDSDFAMDEYNDGEEEDEDEDDMSNKAGAKQGAAATDAAVKEAKA